MNIHADVVAGFAQLHQIVKIFWIGDRYRQGDHTGRPVHGHRYIEAGFPQRLSAHIEGELALICAYAVASRNCGIIPDATDTAPVNAPSISTPLIAISTGTSIVLLRGALMFPALKVSTRSPAR